MPNNENENLTEEMASELVKKRRIGTSDSLTIPALFKKAFRFLREENVYFAPRIERTPEGRMLLVFEEVKP